MASSKHLYVGEYLAKGTFKTIFNVVEHILPDGVQNEDRDINITPHHLEKINIIVNTDLDANDVVVSRIPLYIDDYKQSIENINLHLMFASMNNAPQIYGVVFVDESTDSTGIKHIETNKFSISPGIRIIDPYKPIDYREKDISVFIFQERCIMDLKKQIDNMVSNIKNDVITESTIESIIESMIFNHLDDSISLYVDEMEFIELDYKVQNICLQKIDGPQKYKWTSFDFGTIYTLNFSSLPRDLKYKFAKNSKIYMMILMLITVSYSFRKSRHADPGVKIRKIKEIISNKLTSDYQINFNTIVDMLDFFDEYKYDGEHKFFTRLCHPEFNLTHYAGGYFIADFNRRRSSDVLPEHIQAEYQKYSPSQQNKRTATLVCGILGLEFGSNTDSLSNTMRLGGKRRRKSKKSILIKKHLNKRASKYTNARTKKSNSK